MVMVKRLVLAFMLCVFYTVIGRAQGNTASDAEIDRIVARLQQTPTFINFTTENVKTIYARGKALGMRPQVFTRMGDSDSDQGAFLRPLGMGPHPGYYCDFGEYSNLQETLDYYSSVPPQEGIDNSFDRVTLTAHRGFSTTSVFDTWWATSQSEKCEVGETPLDCEYRLVQPASAFILFGLIDVQVFTPEEYKANMTAIIEQSIDAGVIPVLTTFLVLEENPKQDWRTALLFDDVLLDLADEYQIPLINMWRELQDLPNKGISADQVHLGYPPSGFCDFTGTQNRYGGVLRNFLTLTALDTLRQEVFLEPES
jgi:hypothetical protein